MSRNELPDVNRDMLIADLVNMIRIPSVNRFGKDYPHQPAEAAMADHFEKRLSELGLETGSREVSQGRRNVWGRLKGAGNGPTVLLAGHFDTVGVDGYDSPFEATVRDGRIYGRGSCDMKAGLAAYLEVVRLLSHSGETLSGDLIICGVVDEEHAMIGSQDFGINGPAVDYAIVAEPTELAICPAHKGQICMTIKTHGLAAHSSMPEKGTNAIYHMAAIVEALQDHGQQLRQRTADRNCGKPSLSVGVIRGGDNACSVPDFCEIDVDRRTIPGENHETVMSELSEIIECVKDKCPDLHCEFLPPFLNLPPLATSETSPVMTNLQAACETVLGRSASVMAFPGSSDAPNFNCPTIVFGAGNLAQCHSLDEYVAIDELEKAVLIYVKTIIALLGDQSRN